MLITKTFSAENYFLANAYAVDTTALRPPIVGDTNARHWPHGDNEFKFHFESAVETEKTHTFEHLRGRTLGTYIVELSAHNSSRAYIVQYQVI